MFANMLKDLPWNVCLSQEWVPWVWPCVLSEAMLMAAPWTVLMASLIFFVVMYALEVLELIADLRLTHGR